MPEIHSIPLLFTGSQWQLFAVQDHFRSILGIICGLRIICGWGSFTILYRSHVTNNVISCNYSSMFAVMYIRNKQTATETIHDRRYINFCFFKKKSKGGND